MEHLRKITVSNVLDLCSGSEAARLRILADLKSTPPRMHIFEKHRSFFYSVRELQSSVSMRQARSVLSRYFFKIPKRDSVRGGCYPETPQCFLALPVDTKGVPERVYDMTGLLRNLKEHKLSYAEEGLWQYLFDISICSLSPEGKPDVAEEEVLQALCGELLLAEYFSSVEGGALMMGRLQEQFHMGNFNQQRKYVREIGEGWLLSGSVDAVEGDVVVEMKNRMRKFGASERDIMQVMLYMWLSGHRRAVIREYLLGEKQETNIEFIDDFVEKMLKFVLALLRTES